MIAGLLIKPEFEEAVGYGNYSCNSRFFHFIQTQVATGIVNVHSLNHDIFFKHVIKYYEEVGEQFTDGFSELGSNIYGDAIVPFKFQNQNIERTYTVRLPKFTGQYNGRLRLYKLHGSIDNYYLLDSLQTRFKRKPGIISFKIETIEPTSGNLNYKPAIESMSPDFLTGTTSKQQLYGGHFYKDIFKNFKKNLSRSNCLLVIGYGFGDPGINIILENNYLINGKKMVLVDIRRPDCDIINRYSTQIKICANGIDNISYDELVKIIM